ncbi:MFS transporter [Candidatus Saccharibacteria bacterium]|nr:MFS transporter [Candidatus Saccharibacteria bacterium]
MKNHQSFAKRLFLAVFSVLFACFMISAPLSTPSYALPNDSETTETTESEPAETSEEEVSDVCSDQSGAIGWIVCPGTGAIAKAIDSIYDVIERFLKVEPLSTDNTSTIHLVWEYARNITNIVFIIFILIVVWSQLTGIGIGNYGIKRVLPRIIIAAILVNLSFVICQAAVDISNILGSSLRGFFTSVQETAISNGAVPPIQVTWTDLVDALTGTGILAALGITITGGIGALFWTVLPIVLGALVSIVIGLATIAMRQALVALLIMISPLAFVCYLLPNTESWFKKWKDLLTKMLIFFPMFSLLFGASQLAGWAILSSSTDAFGIVLGLAVQVFPLFFSWSLMKMSGTILGTINQRLTGIAAKPLGSFSKFSDSQRIYRRQKYFASSASLGASARRYSDYRAKLQETDLENVKSVYDNNIQERVQRKLAGGTVDDEVAGRKHKTNRYTRTAKKAKNTTLLASNAKAHTEHVLNNYGSYHSRTPVDVLLNTESQNAFLDDNRARFIKEVDDENDAQFLTDKYLAANVRDANGNPIDRLAYERYNRSIAGSDGEQRVLAKIIAQAAKVESKQRAEYHILHAKFGHNGHNKKTFRSWITGYSVDDDGWALDENGKRLYELNDDGSIKRDANGKPIYLETIPGQALTKAPHRIVTYDKRDEQGLYYDMQDQDGNVIARIHRGKGADGLNHDDAAFIKETLGNYDIPIGDPINDVYSILAGIKPGDIQTPQGPNEIGLSRYSTTIGSGLNTYKGNAAWAGSMFNQMVSNRQIHNAAQRSIDMLDSIIKTSKPGALNTQNPASIAQLRAILDPRNWPDLFREEDINGVNINDKLWGGEDWELDADGNIIGVTPVENPTYEQRMNTLKRKFLFPAMEKIVPSIIRNTSPNTVDNQKPGAADEWSKFIDMIESQWTGENGIPNPNIRQYDLLNQTLDLKAAQRDKDGNPIYPNIRRRNTPNTPTNPLNELHEIVNRSLDVFELTNNVLSFLNEHGYYEALEAFDTYVATESPTIEDIEEFIDNTLAPFFTE